MDVPTLTLKIELPLRNYISCPLIRIDPDKMLDTNIGKFAISASFRFSRWGFCEVGRELVIQGRSVLLGDTKVYQTNIPERFWFEQHQPLLFITVLCFTLVMCRFTQTTNLKLYNEASALIELCIEKMIYICTCTSA